MAYTLSALQDIYTELGQPKAGAASGGGAGAREDASLAGLRPEGLRVWRGS